MAIIVKLKSTYQGSKIEAFFFISENGEKM